MEATPVSMKCYVLNPEHRKQFHSAFSSIKQPIQQYVPFFFKTVM